MPWTPNDIPDLTGRTAIVTGGNGGLGLETVKQLADHGAHVVMAARNQDKARTALMDLDASMPGASVELRELDLASLASVRTFAASVLDDVEAVDILVNNAGLMATPEGRTEDGFETQFGVNHLGHYELTARLLPALMRSAGARVVTVTSFARLSASDLDPDDINLEGGYDPWAAYGRSKRANFHFAIGLQDRFDAAGASASSIAAHPGLSHTDLQARTVRMGDGISMAGFWHAAAKVADMDPANGARPQLRAATDPAARGGTLFGPLFTMAGPAVEKPILRRPDPAEIATLFQISESLTGSTIP